MIDASLTLASIVAVFIAGVVAFASPCFLPVVPVFVAYLADKREAPVLAGVKVGTAGDALLTEAESPQGSASVKRAIDWSGAGQALVFMAAFSAVFISLWGLVGLIGYVVGDLKTWLRIAGGIVLVIIGLHATRLISIPLLDRVLTPQYSPNRTEPPNFRRSLLLGLAFGAGWTPCIGPILGGVLGLATTYDSLGIGIVFMAVFSLGLGIPFILVCAGATSVLNRLKWFSAHQGGVSIVVGIFLIIVGFLMITDLFTQLAAWLSFLPLGQ
ncbi:MAG: cytochrome c biogenesis protein CcdA [Propionibacteriaceae bacterium]|nr:cytochrome c biogenesis protein CcdA [Propionibacteriaceae bacterium]